MGAEIRAGDVERPSRLVNSDAREQYVAAGANVSQTVSIAVTLPVLILHSRESLTSSINQYWACVRIAADARSATCCVRKTAHI